MSAFENMMAGFQAGTNLRRQREADARTAELNKLAQTAYGARGAERQQAIGQAVGVDAQAGMALDKGFADTDQRRNTTVANAAKMLMSAPEQYRASVYANMRGDLSQYIPNLPEQYDETVAQAAKSIVSAYGGDPTQELAPRVVGNALVDSTGKVLYQAPDQQEYQWSDRAGAWIPKPMAGGARAFEDGSRVPAPSMTGTDGAPVSIDPSMSPQDIAAVRALEGGNVPGGFTANATQGLAAIPVAGIGPKPDISPAEERRLQLAEEAAQRAREAADRQRFGNAPAGFRFRSDGSLEPIPGGPKPAGAAATEDERKAAGWYMQASKAFKDMNAAMRENGAADDPGFWETYIPSAELANRTRSPERQRYVQAASAFSEAVLRAATGAGVNREEALQKISELTPQRGDSDAVKAQKQASLDNYLQALRARAGRALPQQQPQQASAPKPAKARSILRTGTLNGRRVVQYSDGTTEYAD